MKSRTRNTLQYRNVFDAWYSVVGIYPVRSSLLWFYFSHIFCCCCHLFRISYVAFDFSRHHEREMAMIKFSVRGHITYAQKYVSTTYSSIGIHIGADDIEMEEKKKKKNEKEKRTNNLSSESGSVGAIGRCNKDNKDVNANECWWWCQQAASNRRRNSFRMLTERPEKQKKKHKKSRKRTKSKWKVLKRMKFQRCAQTSIEAINSHSHAYQIEIKP